MKCWKMGVADIRRVIQYGIYTFNIYINQDVVVAGHHICHV